MTPPKQITLLGQTWRVLIEERDEDDPRCFGATDLYARTITLYTEPHERYPQRGTIQATLFHEATHAALASSGAGALLGDGEDDGAEEALVTALEHALFPLIAQGIFK